MTKVYFGAPWIELMIKVMTGIIPDFPPSPLRTSYFPIPTSHSPFPRAPLSLSLPRNALPTSPLIPRQAHARNDAKAYCIRS